MSISVVGATPASAQTTTYGSQQTLPFQGLVLPLSVAVDGTGDAFSYSGYVSGNPGTTIFEVPRTTTGYAAQISIPFSAPISAFALDGHGDIFAVIRVTNMQDSVVERHRTASGYGPETQLATLSGYWPSLAVDSSGDLFAGTLGGTSSVVKLPLTSTGYGAPVVLPFQGLCNPYGVAVDTAGDVFASSDCDGQSGQVLELPVSTQGYGAQSTLPISGLSTAEELSIGGDGSVFVADEGNDRVVLLPRTPSGYGPQEVVAFSGLENPEGVAVDSTGTVLAADTQHNRVVAVHPGGTQAPPSGKYVCPASGTYYAFSSGSGYNSSSLYGSGTCTSNAGSFGFSFTSTVPRFVADPTGACYVSPMPLWDDLGVTLSGGGPVYEFGQIWDMSLTSTAYGGTVTAYGASSPSGTASAALSAQPTCSVNHGIVEDSYPLSFTVSFSY